MAEKKREVHGLDGAEVALRALHEHAAVPFSLEAYRRLLADPEMGAPMRSVIASLAPWIDAVREDERRARLALVPASPPPPTPAPGPGRKVVVP